LLPRDPDLGFTPYLWLVYLGFFLLRPALHGASAWEWVATGIGVCVFLPLYFAGYWIKGPRVLGIVAALATLASVYAPFNYGASTFFIYAAAFIGEAGESRVAFRYLLGLLAWIGLLTWVLDLPLYFWLPALGMSAILGLANIHFAQRYREEWKLNLAHQEIEHLAAVAERERIARDLHDLLGHTLSLIVLKSELASRLAAKDMPRAVAEIQDVERVSREALAQVREPVRGYRTSGIGGEARKACEALEAAGLQVECKITPVAIPAAQETVLALAVREAATNILRHARASACWFELRQENGFVELRVRDNGSGGARAEGSGLAGMRERVRALGGTIQRDASQGTTLIIQLPIEATGAAGAA
jgi:two-component system sensor histidine kinase DesK